MVQAPIFHVNGDDPEACVRVAELAFAYRQQFNKDVVIDMVCYRRHGHNEGDDPSYTQPLMYKRIEQRAVGAQALHRALVNRGDITLEEAELALDDFRNRLQQALDETRQGAPAEGLLARPAPPPLGVLPHVDTSITAEEVEEIYDGAVHGPRRLHHPPQAGPPVRGAHQDVPRRRGRLGARRGDGLRLAPDAGHVGPPRRPGHPARHLLAAPLGARRLRERGRAPARSRRSTRDGSHLWIYDSLLSEYAALGFEYGYSVANKDALVCWEAQFGDFMNGAQIIIDQFLVAAEDKWDQTSGLVLLLPHGYEGQGPEHSSARIERFLILAAEDNIQVVNATTASAVLPRAAPPDHARGAQAARRLHAQVAACGPTRAARR